MRTLRSWYGNARFIGTAWQMLDLPDSGFVALVEGPFLDSFGADQASLAQDLHMFAGCWLTHAKFAGNQAPADSVFHQIAVYLRREVIPRLLEPLQNLQSSLVREGSHRYSRYHKYD